MILSIVVIGKDESKNLAALYQSLNGINLSTEIIYVDSASTDTSVLISQDYAQKIFVLEKSTHLCASAGRYIGAKYSSGDWILFLDGDMILSKAFVNWLNTTDFSKVEDNTTGFVGEYTYIYHNGVTSENQLLLSKNVKYAVHFGGAVLLKKEDILNAGNWNPSVIANEEIDLYARLKHIGKSVEALHFEMVRHQAAPHSKLYILTSLVIPLNKRYFGFGQVLYSQSKHKSLLTFIKLNPYPFTLWLIILTIVFIPYFILLLIIFILYVSYIKKFHYIFIYLTDFPRGILGYLSYKNYKPKITTEEIL